GLSSSSGEKATLHNKRSNRYKESGGWMLVHRYSASVLQDQEYDISIYLVEKSLRNNQQKIKEINFVSYAVGDMWSGSPFSITSQENGFELKLSAYGPFLCIANVHFKDGSNCTLERFIDFEMANS
ncbi:MAG: hypothetical protein Q8T08_05570, partial [Ignavibacteria bacterium]|nr:hypothetical protein [Ignavibacteria bacterium]